jgi:nicotinamidase/pyrazinamidase
LVVDCQNDFADPSGSLFVRGGDAVIERINEAIGTAHSSGAPVIYTQDWHPPSTPHFQKDGGIWPVHCVAGTWGAEFHPDLVVEGPVVRKGSYGEDGYSGFTMRDPLSGEETPTELDQLLRGEGVNRIVLVGLALDYCVKATAMDATRLGYEILVPLELTAAVELRPGDGAAAIAAMRESGVIVD